jgi:hypothetical protein
MPFIVAIPISERGKLYLRRDGEDLIPTPSRARAHRFDEAEADAVAAQYNRYASIEAEVEGARE